MPSGNQCFKLRRLTNQQVTRPELPLKRRKKKEEEEAEGGGGDAKNRDSDIGGTGDVATDEENLPASAVDG